ncbi:MAG: glutamate--tRNA ligase [Chloroflexi bacterium RBG_13_51_36]|nr:MAG: glutamate--tRNA ligase [Chloroflexi bacterium RBG_13_51_36]
MQSESGTSVRVRFAPSPTGYPHLGNIRTALFNWLFARHHDGKFILRIEDTDITRKVEGAVEVILDSLQWLGLDWDEGPYFQSQRLAIYRETVHKLLKEGHAYLCYCSPERLETMRHEQAKQKQPPKYDRHCRDLAQEERTRLESSGATPVVRFRTPLEGETTFHDLVYGLVTFRHDTLDDFVLLKSDGYPTYHLANVIDDHVMTISHVLRAEEWLSSTPRHVLLYQALNWQAPQFGHLPMILGPDRAKLSKRHGSTNINEYQKEGYLPDAMVNFLALLGWSLDDRTEVLSREELIKQFSLERVGKTAAVFNKDKLEWMNGFYLRKLNLGEYVQQAMPFLNRDLPGFVKRPLDEAYVGEVLSLIKERAKTLAEIPQLASFFFLDEIQYDPGLLLGKKLDAQAAAKAITVASRQLQEVEIWDATTLEGNVRPLAGELNLGTGELFGLLRIVVTGRTAAPPLFQTIAVLGKKKCLERFDAALRLLPA